MIRVWLVDAHDELIPREWASAPLVAVGTFVVGRSRKVHRLTHAGPSAVRGACGIVAQVSATGRKAEAAPAALVTCNRCEGMER